VVHLGFPSRSVVVVAGVLGAGKTTLIRRAVDRAVVRVVDTEDRRAEGGRGVVRLYAGHYMRIAGAIAARRPTVIHSRGTHAAARRLIVLMAGLRGRSAHLVLLDADRVSAEAGQRARGRPVGRREMDGQLVRWRRLVSSVRAEGGLRGEGWRSVTILDRADAAAVDAFEVAPAGLTPPRSRLEGWVRPAAVGGVDGRAGRDDLVDAVEQRRV
jgi:hypothetical protein